MFKGNILKKFFYFTFKLNLKMSYENNCDKNPTKPDLSNQIDDIINKYKTQLAELKTGSTKRNNSYIFESVRAKTIKNDIYPNLSNEIQNDNIKLQSLLTEEKFKSTKLKAQIDQYEYELNRTKQEINELSQIWNNKEKEYNQKLKDMEAKINNDSNNKNNIINENNLNRNIIQNFFEFYNRYIDLFYKSRIISFNNAQKLNYLQNDSEGKNQQAAIFVLNNFDILIKKLLQDNKELYEQLIDVRKLMDEQQYLQKELEGMKSIKVENLSLKETIQKLNQENNIIKNDNSKLKSSIIELNNYINNRLDTDNFYNQMKRNFQNFSCNNINNYNSQRIHSQTRINNSMNNNYHKVINHENSFKNKRSFNKSIDIGNMNNKTNKKKLCFYGVNTNYTNRSNLIPHNNNKFYSKTDENRKINNYDENSYINNHNDNHSMTNNNPNSRIISVSGFERPIEKLKKKIMILEEQIKNNQE